MTNDWGLEGNQDLWVDDSVGTHWQSDILSHPSWYLDPTSPVNLVAPKVLMQPWANQGVWIWINLNYVFTIQECGDSQYKLNSVIKIQRKVLGHLILSTDISAPYMNKFVDILVEAR